MEIKQYIKENEARFMEELFSLSEYTNEVKPLVTFGDVCDYLARENDRYKDIKKRMKEYHARRVSEGSEWPDEL